MNFEFKGVVIPTDEWFVVLDGNYPEGTVISWSDIFDVVARKFPCFKPNGKECEHECYWNKNGKCKAPKYRVKINVEFERID